MSFYDYYSRFFNGRYGRPPENEDERSFNLPSDQFWSPDGKGVRDFPSMFDFKVMSDPFEMHQYFEKKINEVMQAFMSPEMFPGIEGFGAFDPPSVPAIQEKQHPRDFYLKPGVGKSAPDGQNDEKELVPRSGGESSSSWWDSFLPSPPHSQPNNTFSTFRSVTRKTVVLPDGTMKTEETIRNSDGTNEKTESHTVPDGSNPPAFDFHFETPDLFGLFGQEHMPETKRNTPRDHFLKPGYEKLNPNSTKVDTDLDKQILQSGVESLPPFSKEPQVIEPNQNLTFRSITKRTVTLPNGVVESEEVVRNSDGSEQRTVTQTWPDGTPVDPSMRSSFADSYQNNKPMIDHQSITSFTMRGVKDLLDVLFK